MAIEIVDLPIKNSDFPKLSHNYGKIHHAMKTGKLTISMAIFNSYVTNYQRVSGNHGLHHQLFWGR
jgi:hypothetical protein